MMGCCMNVELIICKSHLGCDGWNDMDYCNLCHTCLGFSFFGFIFFFE